MAKNKRQKRRERNETPREIFGLTDVERAGVLAKLASCDQLTDSLEIEIENLLKSHQHYTHCCFVVEELNDKTCAYLSLCYPADPAIGDESRSGVRYGWLMKQGEWVADDVVLEFGG